MDDDATPAPRQRHPHPVRRIAIVVLAVLLVEAIGLHVISAFYVRSKTVTVCTKTSVVVLSWRGAAHTYRVNTDQGTFAMEDSNLGIVRTSADTSAQYNRLAMSHVYRIRYNMYHLSDVELPNLLAYQEIKGAVPAPCV